MRVLCVLALLATSVVTASTTAVDASTETHVIRPVYYVPVDAPRSDRAPLVDQAMQQIQAQWARFGLTFRLLPAETVVAESIGCGAYGDGAAEPLFAEIGGDVIANATVKTVVFGECLRLRGAVANACCNRVLYSIMNSLEADLAASTIGGYAVATIGHELGHLFALPHENCGGKNLAQATRLVEVYGLPGYATNSLTCQQGGLLGIEDPSVNWIRDRMLYSTSTTTEDPGCEFFVECSGGSIPAIADTPLTVEAQQIRNANGDCLQVTSIGGQAAEEVVTSECVDGQAGQLFRAIPARTNVQNIDRDRLVYEVDGLNLRSAATGWCLGFDSESVEVGAALYESVCDYRDSNVVYVDGSEIRTKHSGLCLAATGVGDGSPVVQQTCDARAEQTWAVTVGDVDVPGEGNPVINNAPVGDCSLTFTNSSEDALVAGLDGGASPGGNRVRWLLGRVRPGGSFTVTVDEEAIGYVYLLDRTFIPNLADGRSALWRNVRCGSTFNFPDGTVSRGPGPAALGLTHTVSCLAGNGRVDTNIVNEGDDIGVYRLEFQGLTPRQQTAPARDWLRFPVTGRADGDYTISVKRNGQVISNQLVTVDCDSDTPTVDGGVRVINACRAGKGYLLFQLVNPTPEQRSWTITFSGVPNRSTTAAPYGASVRAVTGRPSGRYNYIASSGVSNDGGVVPVDC